MLIPPVTDPARLQPDPQGRIMRWGGDTMGTSWQVSAVVAASIDEEQLRAGIEKGFAKIIGQMSQWDQGSELSLYNRAPAGEWIDISPQFMAVLAMALDIAEASNGAFDPAIGHLTDLWGFGADSEVTALPNAQNIEQARTFDWQDIRLDRQECRIFQPGGLSIDLSAIAKGFAVDYTAAYLEGCHIHHALIEIGGELRAIGVKPDGLPWWVDIEQSGKSGACRIALSGWSVATSGDYLRRRSANGESWSHNISSKTGRPLTDALSSVTVLHPGCMQADALATAIMVMGVDSGMTFADHHRIAARMIAEGKTYSSKKWAEYCEE